MSEYERLKKQFDEIKAKQDYKSHEACRDKIASLQSRLQAAVKLAKIIKSNPHHLWGIRTEEEILDLADAVLGENK